MSALSNRFSRIKRTNVLTVFPLLTVGAYWLGNDAVLFLASILLPVFLIAERVMAPVPPPVMPGYADTATALPLSDFLIATYGRMVSQDPAAGARTACFDLVIDDFPRLRERLPDRAAEEILRRLSERVQSVLRERDTIVRRNGAGFAILLSPSFKIEPSVTQSIADRLQQAISEPISVEGQSLYLTASIGICLGRDATTQTGQGVLDAAAIALTEARRNGPGMIRVFSKEMQAAAAHSHALQDEIADALDGDQIIAHFQPQVCARTGTLTGFEALARWQHPVHGMLPPLEFLGAVDAAGQYERLGEVMLFHALTALRQWDEAGIHVPQVGVNFSAVEFANPRLVEKLTWELERFQIPANRLSIEILESVVASAADDTTVENIRKLAALGCKIDVDDFGTGNASITTLRRFPVDRIKIDRSFVTRIDEDSAQLQMVSAILTMADRLGLECLAEGVETLSEMTLLSELGCHQVQGYGLGKPMAYDATLDWLTDHQRKMAPKEATDPPQPLALRKSA